MARADVSASIRNGMEADLDAYIGAKTEILSAGEVTKRSCERMGSFALFAALPPPGSGTMLSLPDVIPAQAGTHPEMLPQPQGV
jgi:hypothetical protein